MYPLLRPVALLPVLLSVACTTYGEHYHVGAEDHVLSSRTAANGLSETISLHVRASGGDASLEVTTETSTERASLGIQVAELDRQRADNRGVKPFSGLLVVGIHVPSGADEAGVEVGDVLLSLGGKETVYLPQLEQVESTLQADQVVKARVLRGQTEEEISLTPRRHERRGTRVETVPLERATITHRPYAGVTLRGIPAAWCERIYGVVREAVVVTSVEVGSPAWVAGVRGGDVIEELDGAPVPPVSEVTRQIAERGPAGDKMRLRVRRGEQSHEAELELSDYSGEANVWIPLIARYQNGAYMDRWSLGPFGLLLSNRNSYVANTATRAVQTKNVFSAVLGLLRVESTPHETDVRLLWFLHFDS